MIYADRNIKAIVFDMDGVIIDTEKYLTKYWCMAAREYGYPMELQHAFSIRSLQGKYASCKLKDIFGNEFDYEKVRNRRKELMNDHIMKNGIEGKPYVREALEILKGKGYVLAIATSTDYERTKQYLSDIGVFSYFDTIVCANMVTNGKPDPDIYLYACEQLGLPPQECIAVEDSPNGVKSAVAAGVNVVMIPDLTEATEDELEHAIVLENLKELADNV